MKILFIHSYYYPEVYGGAEYSVKKLAEELVKNGHQCYVYCTGERDFEETINGVIIFRRKGAVRSRIDKLGAIKRPIHFIGEIYSPNVSSQLNRILDACKPDIVHTNCLYYLSSNVWRVAYRRGIPIVQTIRDYFFICYRGFSDTAAPR